MKKHLLYLNNFLIQRKLLALTLVGSFLLTNFVFAAKSSSSVNLNANSSIKDISERTHEGTQNHINYFRLILNTAPTTDATVKYTTRDGSAIAGQDYIFASGTAIILAGETETLIGVEIIADPEIEEDETFDLVISSPKNGKFSSSVLEISKTHTIVDTPASNIVITPKSPLSICLEEQFSHSPSQIELQTIISLDCQNKSLTDNDIIELGQLTSLTELNLNGNEFNDPSPISYLTQLTSLSLSGDPSNTVTQTASTTAASSNLSEVIRTPQANHVVIQNIGLTSVSFLSGLTQLTHLDVSHNQITDISPLASLTNLTELRFEHNHVTDISVLVSLTNLIDVYLTYNCITDFSPIYVNGTSTPFINTISAVLGILNQSSNCPTSCNTPANNICNNLTIDSSNQDILVNANTLGGQEFAKVTALDDGGWIITWSSQNSASWNTYMQQYNSCGLRVGNETLVNTTTTDNEWLQDIVTLSDGSYVVLWNHSKTIGINISNPGIYMQHYSDNSILQGTETLLKSFPTTFPKYSVAELNNLNPSSCQSNFVMAWDDYDGDDIKMQRYTSSGQLIGNEITGGYTNAGYLSGRPDASIATLQDGGWVLVWFEMTQVNANQNDGVYMQRYNSAGLLVGTTTHISIQDSMNWYKSSVIGLQNGGWLVAIPRDGTPIGIRLLQYNANGVQVSSQLIATTHNFGPGMFPLSVIELSNNDWVVAWSSFGYPANNYTSGAYIQRFDSNGTAVGNEIRANQYLTSHDFPPKMAALPDGGWITTWNSFGQDGDRYGVYMKRYDALGNVIH